MEHETEIRWIGDYAVIFTYAALPYPEAVEFTRQMLIDYHGFDPLAHGFTPEEYNHV